jgi:hypothetical protein
LGCSSAPCGAVSPSSDAPSLGVGQATRVLGALAERGVGYVVLGDRALGRALVDAVVDIGADGTWTQTPMKEETR